MMLLLLDYTAGVLRWEYPVELPVARMLDACVESKSMLEVVVGVDGKESNVTFADDALMSESSVSADCAWMAAATVPDCARCVSDGGGAMYTRKQHPAIHGKHITESPGSTRTCKKRPPSSKVKSQRCITDR